MHEDANSADWFNTEPAPRPKKIVPDVQEPGAVPLTLIDRILRRVGAKYQSQCPCCVGLGYLTITQDKKERAA